MDREDRRLIDRNQRHAVIDPNEVGVLDASAVPKVRGNGRSEDVIFFDGVFFKPSMKSIFFVS